MKKLLLLLILFTNELPATVYLEPLAQFKPCVEVAAAYIEHDGKILLLHRQDNKSQGNRWGIPGGKVEKNETPLQAVIREVKEETGLDLLQDEDPCFRLIYFPE